MRLEGGGNPQSGEGTMQAAKAAAGSAADALKSRTDTAKEAQALVNSGDAHVAKLLAKKTALDAVNMDANLWGYQIPNCAKIYAEASALATQAAASEATPKEVEKAELTRLASDYAIRGKVMQNASDVLNPGSGFAATRKPTISAVESDAIKILVARGKYKWVVEKTQCGLTAFMRSEEGSARLADFRAFGGPHTAELAPVIVGGSVIPVESKGGSDVVIQGTLKKKSVRQIMAGWKPRFFVLRAHVLEYYDQEGSPTPKSRVPVPKMLEVKLGGAGDEPGAPKFSPRSTVGTGMMNKLLSSASGSPRGGKELKNGFAIFLLESGEDKPRWMELQALTQEEAEIWVQKLEHIRAKEKGMD